MQAALGEKVRSLVLPPTLNPPQSSGSDADKPPTDDASVNLLTVTNLNYREKAEGVMTIAGAIDRLLGRQDFDLPIQYDVVGGGYQLDFLRHSIGDNSIIRLHGRSDNVAEFYRRADIFVYCSTLDGYPLVLCEAQSYGLPIVANRWGAFPDMLSENEDSLFFDGDDSSQLAGLLSRLIEDESLRTRMSQAAAASFVARHSSIDCGNRLRQFLQSLI
jgi:glycosyltransferase involved in cell wall biosynthesis